ncbi:hypothetical protein QYF61_020042 [Mycteria americana]|uniref:Uncharacterized protein n=1 Tax=Mycteria americana TaxID=33587 RepID=A0AAN7PKH9_MYCAM|nr:hypothetical protein QYF61_020042 [Mycteria americana]
MWLCRAEIGLCRNNIHLDHFNLRSLIHLLVVLMFFSGPTLGCVSIYMTYFYNQLLYPGSNILPQCSSPDGFTSALPLEYSGPQILCIPNSKTRGVNLESPLVLSARGSRLNRPNSLSFSSYERCSMPFISPSSPSWPFTELTPVCACLSCTGESRARPSIPDAASSGLSKRGRITSLDLLAVPCLVKPQRLLAFFATNAHCWLMVNLVPTSTSRAFFAKLLQSLSTSRAFIAEHDTIRWGVVGFDTPSSKTLEVDLRFLLVSQRLQSIERAHKLPFDSQELNLLARQDSLGHLWHLNNTLCMHFETMKYKELNRVNIEVKFPNIQSKPPLVQLEAISSRPITCYLGEETDPHLSTTSFQTLHQLRCPSLDTLQHLNVSLVVRGPKLNTVFKVRPHQCRVQGHDHFPSPAGHAIPDTSQDAVVFLGHLGTLLAHIQPAVNQHPQVLLCLAAFQPLFPKPVALHGVAVSQVQDLALGLVEPHTIGLSPWIRPVQIPL